MKYKVGDWLLFYKGWDREYEISKITSADTDYYHTFILSCGFVYEKCGFSVNSPFERDSIKIDKLELVDILYGLTND